MALYLSFLSPNVTMSAQCVSSRLWIRVFSSLSGDFPLICFTVLSFATTVIMSGEVSFFKKALACINKFSWPACK